MTAAISPMHWRLHIVAQGPLIFAQRKVGTQFRESQTYIPGGTLFGALAHVFQQQKQFNAPLLRALRCHNAYAALPDDPWVRPLPATARNAKGASGVADLYDSLVVQVCAEQQQPPALLFVPTDRDGNPLQNASGLYTIRNKTIALRSAPPQRILTRVGINRRRNTAEESLLYSPMVLTEVRSFSRTEVDANPALRERNDFPFYPTHFVGSVVCDLASLPDPAAAQQQIAQALTSIAWVGGRQTTGLGRVQVQPTPQPDNDPELETRIIAMTNAFRAQAEIYAQLDGEPWACEGHIFTINLLSDAILLENGWQPTMVMTSAMLKAATGNAIDASLLRSFASYDYVGGWNVLWQRPKETHVAAQKGSVYVFQTAKPLTATQFDALKRLQLIGIGERVQEGFGQVRICDEFHAQLNRKPTKNVTSHT